MQSDTPVFWELMFPYVLSEKDAAGIVGEILAARYGPPEKRLPSEMEELLGKLDRAEISNSPPRENAVMQPLLVAFEIVDAIERAASTRSALNVEATADAIIARNPESGLTRQEIAEVLREEGAAAKALIWKSADMCGEN